MAEIIHKLQKVILRQAGMGRGTHFYAITNLGVEKRQQRLDVGYSVFGELLKVSTLACMCVCASASVCVLRSKRVWN